MYLLSFYFFNLLVLLPQSQHLIIVQVFILLISVDPLSVFSGMFSATRQSLEAFGTIGQAEQPGKPAENNSNLTVHSET